MINIHDYDPEVFNDLPTDKVQFGKVLRDPVPETAMEAIR